MSDSTFEGFEPANTTPTVSGQEKRNHHGFAQVPRLITRGRLKKTLSLAEKGLYACLKDICGDDGECYYTYRNLAEEIGTSISTLSRHIPALAKKGVITAELKPRGNGANQHEIWHIRIVDLWEENDALYTPASAEDCFKMKQSSAQDCFKMKQRLFQNDRQNNNNKNKNHKEEERARSKAASPPPSSSPKKGRRRDEIRLTSQGQRIHQLYEQHKGRKIILSEKDARAVNALGGAVPADDYLDMLKEMERDEFIQKKDVDVDLTFQWANHNRYLDRVYKNRKKAAASSVVGNNSNLGGIANENYSPKRPTLRSIAAMSSSNNRHQIFMQAGGRS